MHIKINNNEYNCNPNETVIQVADRNDIYIPRFCYHESLSIAANCRMCLIEQKGIGKPLPACATPVSDGAEYFTSSEMAKNSQKNTMELLLINHPLDCPVCDQGGMCELQDLAMNHSDLKSRYTQEKRVVFDYDIGPLIKTNMTRCIHCTRCVRFGEEVVGQKELGVINRGESLEIRSFLSNSVESPMSGNMIDICPVGALNSKPSHMKGRPWEYNEINSVSHNDCLGSNTFIHSNSKSIYKVTPRENKNINDIWLSDRDRFSYESIDHVERTSKPMIKIEDRFEEVSWQKAIQFLKDKISQNELSNSCALINPDSTTEELFLFQKLMRGLNINNIDHRIHSVDFRNQDSYETYPRLNENINDIKNKDVILLIDSNVSYDQPILSYHIRKAYKNNCKILSLNTYNYNYNFDTDYQKLVQPDLLVDALASIYVKLCKLNEANYKNINFEKSINLSLDVDPIVDSITNSNNLQIILGSSTISHPDYDLIKYLSNQIADILNIKLSILLNGCNTPGAWITGCVPHRKAGGEKINSTSLNFQECLEVKPDFTFLFNIEPDDTVLRNEFQKFLSGSKFVIGIQNFINEKDLDLYDVLLPLSTHYETSGSYINIEGKSQYFDKACDNLYDSKEGWKILTYLANNLDLNNFNYEDISDIQEEINSIIRKNLYFEFNFDSDLVIKKSLSPTNSIRYGNFHHYFTNAMLRRASSLLKTIPKNNVIKVNNKTLQLFDVNTTKNKVLIKQKDKSLLVDLLIDENVSDNCVYITTSSENYYDLGNNFENIVIENV